MKEGWKTTEFWLGLFGVLFVFLNEQLGWHFEAQTIISAVTMIVGYVASRTVLKLRVQEFKGLDERAEDRKLGS